MKIAVLGATGQTGQYLVSQALQQGHTVTAIVRNPGKLAVHHENLKVGVWKLAAQLFNCKVCVIPLLLGAKPRRGEQELKI